MEGNLELEDWQKEVLKALDRPVSKKENPVPVDRLNAYPAKDLLNEALNRLDQRSSFKGKIGELGFVKMGKDYKSRI